MRILLIPILLTTALLFGCGLFRFNENKFAVNVKYQTDVKEAKLSNVSVIIGSDKFWWSDIKAGEEKNVNLYTEKNSFVNITLIYEINGEEMSWESEYFTVNSNYAVDLEVDSKGVVNKTIKSK